MSNALSIAGSMAPMTMQVSDLNTARSMYAMIEEQQKSQEQKSILGKIAGGLVGGLLGAVGGPAGMVVGAGLGVAAASGAEQVFSTEKGGNVGGAVVGGLVGSAFGPIGTLAGGAIGTLIGGKIGEKNEQQNALANYGYMSMMYPSMMGGNLGVGLGLSGIGMGSGMLAGIGTNNMYNYSNNGYNFSTSLGNMNGMNSMYGMYGMNGMSGMSGMSGFSSAAGVATMASAQFQNMQAASSMMANYLNTYGSDLSSVINMYGGTDSLMQSFNTSYMNSMNNIK
ncbi:MAG: glycine zipper domain-containing protein [Candidatus Bruticola sp.]